MAEIEGIKGITCVNCHNWFTVIANLSEDVQINFCPFCGHEFTQEETDDMLGIYEDDDDFDDGDDIEEEDEFEEDEEIEGDDSEDEDMDDELN